MADQQDLFGWKPPAPAPPDLPHFDGETFSPTLDRLRLATVLGAVWRCLSGGKHHTLHELHAAVEADLGRTVSQTSVSSKLRDLRKPDFGAFDVQSERVKGGTWSYWIEEG